MKIRPWPLLILALAQILTPVFTILFNAWMLKVSPQVVLGFLLERPPLEIFTTLALMPLAGVAIYLMKSWSYVVFFTLMLWSVVSNVMNWEYAKDAFSIPAILGLHVLQIALAAYFLIPSVRKTYLDPSVRWWEAKARYELEVPVIIESGGQSHGGVLLNISEGGAFVKLSDPVAKGNQVRMDFPVLSQKFSVAGRVVHVRGMASTKHFSYGIEFDHEPATRRRFKALTRALKDLGFPDRSGNLPWYKELTNWASTLLRTGKGLTPQVRERSKT